jgi:beta-glucosidase
MSLVEKASLLSGKNYWETSELSKYNIPSIFLSDGPYGVRKQVKAADQLGLNPSLPATCFPTTATTANSWDTDLVESVGKAIGLEAVSEKVNVLLGPGVNIKRNPLCGRNFEYYSEDPILAGKLASSFIRGVQSNGIAACVKHFACNNQETRRLSIDTIVDERTLREIYLTPFEIAVKEGKVRSVMSAYNRLNGDFCNENIHLQNGILRNDWGFDGVVITDWGANNDRVKGLIAGNSLEMPSTGGETNRDIVAAVRCGLIKREDLDLAVDRMLSLTFDTEKVYKRKRKPFNVTAHHELAEKAAEESMVLLKNNGILPLDSIVRVSVVGDFARQPRYQGAGSAIVNPTRLDNFLDCIKKSELNYVGFERGYRRYGKKQNSLIKKALTLATKSDVVLAFVGLDEVTEGEGFDRNDLKIPQNQLDMLDALIKTGKKICVVISGGSVVEMPFVNDVGAILDTFLSGQAGAMATLNVITGKVNPSGKLSETYPLLYSDVPSAKHFANNEKTVEYREGIYVGYRYYETAGVPVLFPFGFGLSYTNFEYSNLSVDDGGAYFTLTNAGSRAGAEIAQLYVGKKHINVFRPKKELKGFQKIYLEPGESKRVSILFDKYTFRYFNVLTNSWEIEPGSYQIMVGSSCQDIRLESELAQKGTMDLNPYDKKKLSSYYSGKIEDVDSLEFEELLCKPIPNPGQDFIRKKRIIVDYNTIVADLRYSKGFVGRMFARSLVAAMWFLRHFGKRQEANTLQFGVYHQPMRSLSRMTVGRVSWKQLNGLILMFNGHAIKGLHEFIREGHRKKLISKAERITWQGDDEKQQEILRQREDYVALIQKEDEEKRSNIDHEA